MADRSSLGLMGAWAIYFPNVSRGLIGLAPDLYVNFISASQRIHSVVIAELFLTHLLKNL